MTTFAFQGGLLGQLAGLPGFGTRTYGAPGAPIIADTIASAYINQGLSNGQLAGDECLQPIAQIAGGSQIVSNPCPLDKPFNDPSCGSVAAGEIDARSLVCGISNMEPLDDIAVALNGLHPKDVWLTRIEADLPRAALGQDLILQAAKDQKTVDNIKVAGVAKNTQVICGTEGSIVPIGTIPNPQGPRGRENIVVLVGLGLVSLAALARRRRFAFV